MAKKKKTPDYMDRAIKIGTMTAGAWAGAKLVTGIEGAMLKTSPKMVMYAPGLTAAAGILGGVLIPEKNIAAFSEGVAVQGLLEVTQNIEATIKAKKEENNNGNNNNENPDDSGKDDLPDAPLNKVTYKRPTANKYMPGRLNNLTAKNLKIK